MKNFRSTDRSAKSSFFNENFSLLNRKMFFWSTEPSLKTLLSFFSSAFYRKGFLGNFTSLVCGPVALMVLRSPKLRSSVDEILLSSEKFTLRFCPCLLLFDPD
jgi:hypothetical protein